MLLEVLFRLSCTCLLLCSSGFGYPFQTKVQTGTAGGSIQGGASGTGTYPSGLGPGYYYGFPHSPGGGAGPGSGAGGTGSNSGLAGTGSSGSRTSGVGSGSRSASSGFPVFRSFPWGYKFVVPPTFFNMNQVRLPRFPFGNPWDTNSVPLGSVVAPPLPPMSHVVQTSNGYQRARSVLAHSKYSPHEWSVLPLRSRQVHNGGQVKNWNKNVL